MSKKKEENQAQDPTLSGKRRTSLIIYLAILFLAALAVVTLSLVIQIRGNTEQYNTISQKAYALQEKNEELQKEKETQRQEYETLRQEADRLTKENEQLRTQIETQQSEYAQLQEKLDAANAQTDRILLAYDLLSDVRAAAEAQDSTAFQNAVKTLEPLYSCLNERAQAEYDALLNAMTPEEP